jgi:O-antigen/teichoic acid export membrane protein
MMQIVNYAQTYFDRAFLLVYVSLATLGIYNAAVTAFGVLQGVSGGMANVLFAAYSSLQENGEDRSRMQVAVKLGTRYATLTVTPLAFALLAAAKPALTLLAGDSYAGGSLSLSIFSGAFALTVFATALGPIFLALEETNIAAMITGVTVVLGVALAYMLLPEWGIIGAAAARALAMILGTVLLILILSRKITLELDLRLVAKTLIAGTTMAAVVVAVQLVEYSKFMLPLYALVGTVVYLIMLRLLKTVDASDLNLLRRFLGKRLLLLSSILSWVLLGTEGPRSAN